MISGKGGLVAVATLLGGTAVIVAGLGAGWFGDEAASDGRDLSRGAAIYADACAACHGADLSGAEDWRTRLPSGRLPAPPHDATGHSWHHPDQHLFALTALGPGPFAPPGYESDMPAFRDRLSDDQIWAVLSFIKSRWPADIRAAHDRISAGMAR